MEPKKLLIIALIGAAAVLAFFILSPTSANAQTPGMGGGAGTGGRASGTGGSGLAHGLGWNPGSGTQPPVNVDVTAPGPCVGVDPNRVVATNDVDASAVGLGIVVRNYNCAGDLIAFTVNGKSYLKGTPEFTQTSTALKKNRFKTGNIFGA